MNHPPIATAIPNVGRLPLGHFALTHHKSCSGMSGGTWRRALVSTSPTNSPRSQLDQASVGPAGSSLIYGGSCSHPTGSATNVLCPSLNRSEPSPINCGATMDQNPNPSIRRLIRVASGWIWGPSLTASALYLVPCVVPEQGRGESASTVLLGRPVPLGCTMNMTAVLSLQ